MDASAPCAEPRQARRQRDPVEGRILLDGHDLREYDLEALRGNLGVIFQDFVRFNLNAGDNIAVGKIAARNDRARIERAAKRSQADEVIAKLPGGYQQMIGKRFKAGVELSGGEWQKIAIARATFRFISDPSAEVAALLADDVDDFPEFPIPIPETQRTVDPGESLIPAE